VPEGSSAARSMESSPANRAWRRDDSRYVRVESTKGHTGPLEVRLPMKGTLLVNIGSVILATVSFAADDPKLVGEAKIKETEARATALAQVKNGTVRAEELEREHGHLIYSYDIEVPGKSGIDEVNVDAMTGTVIGKTHEGPKVERKEAAEAKKKVEQKP
jgi:uncharacterized membrane protein YkoI